MNPSSSSIPDSRRRLPDWSFPVLIVDTGGIVRDARLPAHRMAGFPAWGRHNRTRPRAEAFAAGHGLGRGHDNLGAAIKEAPKDFIHPVARVGAACESNRCGGVRPDPILPCT